MLGNNFNIVKEPDLMRKVDARGFQKVHGKYTVCSFVCFGCINEGVTETQGDLPALIYSPVGPQQP